MNSLPLPSSPAPRSVQVMLAILILAIVGLIVAAWVVSREVTPAVATQVEVVHPMDGLTAEEYRLTKDLLSQAGYVDQDSRYPLITLQEPVKAEVLAWQPGKPIERSAFAMVKQGDQIHEATVDLSARQVTSWRSIEGVQPNILIEEWVLAQTLTKADPRWQAAMQARGMTDFEQVFCAPLSAGYFALPEEEGRRLVRVPCFDERGVKTNVFGKPIEGLFAVVDLNQRQVLQVVDTGVILVTPDSQDYDEASVGTLRSPLKPVQLVQPKGKNFTIDHSLIRWQNWSFHVRVDRRLGPIISLVDYADRGQQRPVLYEAALSEIFVPYMNPEAGWSFRTYMDSGEYGFGLLATPLVAGLDCPTTATFLSATLADDQGEPFIANQVICVFERYQGDPVWRHSEIINGTYESRPQVDLVVRSIATIGNYDYALDWVFNQAGFIKVMVGATGLDAVKGVKTLAMSDPSAADETAYGTLLAPGLLGVNHDHFFNFRLDLDVDGPNNSFVREVLKTQQLPQDNPRRSLWFVEPELAKTDSEAKYRLSYDRPSIWRVINPNQKTAIGHAPGYQIMALDNQRSLLSEVDYPQRRANFIDYHLWITPYSPDEIYAAGTYPNQSKGGDGLPEWTSHQRSIVNTDLVAWYTLGFHHVPSAEDWPVMSTSWHGFVLKPFNFFDRNPAIDIAMPDQS